MNSERELFEEWLKSIHYEYEVCWRVEYNCYNSRPLNDMFKAWQASANRQGYKLVPVEPTSDMLKSGNAEREGKCCCTESIYKAMIGAVE